MSPAQVWYFAYGSNMSRAQMKSRARTVGEERLARLENHQVVFNKKARGGTATANIRPAAGNTVHGVLYRIPESAFKGLDRYEGVPEHYRRVEVNVIDCSGQKVAAQVYMATKVENKRLRPAPYYLRTILDGALEHGLPDSYIAEIQALAEGA